MVGRLGVHTANAASRVVQEAGKQGDVHVQTQPPHMVADHAEDILGRLEDAGVKFHVKGVRLILKYIESNLGSISSGCTGK